MRILQINSVCGIRSTGRICTDLAAHVAKAGHECRIAYGRAWVPEPFAKDSVRIGTDLDVALHGAKARLLDASGLGSRRATARFIDWVESYDPDVIHLHNLHGYYLDIELLFRYLRTCRKRIIWTLHDAWAFTGHCANFASVRCDRWKTGCGRCPQIHAYPASLLRDASAANLARKSALMRSIPDLTIVSPSEWLAAAVRESFLGGYEVAVIPNAVDSRRFHPTSSDFRVRHRLEERRIILGVASTWTREKGLEDMIALSRLVDDGTTVVLVGLSRRQIARLPRGVVGIAATDRVEELAGIYSTADVFVNPTHEDNYPTTNLEARACGTPIVTYPTPGSVESAGPDAIVAEEPTPDGLVRAISAALGACRTREPERDPVFFLDGYAALYGLSIGGKETA